MSSDDEQHDLRRKRRRFAQKDDLARQQKNYGKERSDSVGNPGEFPHLDFVRLISLIIEHDVPILWSGGTRPRNGYAMIGAGGSFLVFREERTMDDLILPPDRSRSTDKTIVLKRTRVLHASKSNIRDSQNPRYASVLAEIQILLHPHVASHPNFIDLHGLTWDYETDENDGSISIWPVLALQQALYSMDALLDELFDAPLSEKIPYCRDVAKGLSFLHDCGVVHCDVKPENILICVNSESGTIAKLSDFGSAIMEVTADTDLPQGVAGTRPWNAPEHFQPLKGLETFKIDVFSFGMLLWRFLCHSPRLQAIREPDQGRRGVIVDEIESLKRSGEICAVAVSELRQSTENDSEVIASLLQEMLVLKPEDRCSMGRPIEVLQNLLPRSPESSILESGQSSEATDLESSSPGPSAQHPHATVCPASVLESRIPAVPPYPFYNDFDSIWEVLEAESIEVKRQLIGSLKFIANQRNQEASTATEASVAAEAAYVVSQCYANGFGGQPDLSECSRWCFQAACLGSVKARADSWKLASIQRSATGRADDQSQNPLLTTWLIETTRLGALQAARNLKDLDPENYAVSILAWKHRFATISIKGETRTPNYSQARESIRSLTKEEVNTTSLNVRGYHLIHVAASLNFLDIIQRLAEDSADINVQSVKGETALLCACRAGNAQVALSLLELGASIQASVTGETPLHWLVALPETAVDQVAQALIAQGADLEAENTGVDVDDLMSDTYPLGTPLDWAIHTHATAAIEVLIEHGADPFNECSGCSPFVRAVSKHDFEIVKILLQSRHATSERLISVDASEQTILFHAIYCNNLYDRVLAHGTGHMLAAKNTIELLLSVGCHPDSVDGDDTTALHVAAGYCDLDFLKMLCEGFGWDRFVNTAVGEYERTPLFQAIASHRIENVRYLIALGANTYCQTKGHTLLHICAGANDEEFSMQVLRAIGLDGRADLDLRSPDDNLTAYEIAVLQCHLKVADLLVHHGADISYLADRQPPLLSNIIADPTWNSFRSLQYYLDKGHHGFVLRPSSNITALHLAASAMDALADPNTGDAKLEMLLKAFSDVEKINARTRSSDAEDTPPAGQTPLHFAAKFGVYFATRRLLNAGANPNLRDAEGMTPADLAAKQLALFDQFEISSTSREWVGLSNLRSTHALLKQALEGEREALSSMPTRLDAQDARVGEYTRSRFSMLGFQTD